ncbi:MAG: hypothetical protein KF819_23840 [Labilithrix sp.]|nr:hypothetical protein [Labilithrix sp.]
MGLCTDDATTYLKRLGYNVVRHPREGVNPLDLVGRQNGETRYLGSLDQLIKRPPETALPPVKTDEVAGDVQGQASSKLNFAIGVNLLQSVLSALGGNAGINVGYKGAKTVQFVFDNVLTDSVRPLDLGDYLKAGEVDDANLILQQYVLGNGRLFVVTRTVKTNKFTVKAESSSGTEAALDVPAIQKIVSGNVKVTAAAEKSGTVSYEGDKKLVFGFECFEVGVAGGTLSLMSSKSGAVALSAGSSTTVKPTIVDENGLLDFDE